MNSKISVSLVCLQVGIIFSVTNIMFGVYFVNSSA